MYSGRGGADGPMPAAYSYTLKTLFIPTMREPGAAAASKRGALFGRSCASCHGGNARAGGYAPDLRASPITLSAEAFRTVVQKGSLETRGMPGYGELGDSEIEELRLYVRKVARDSLAHP